MVIFLIQVHSPFQIRGQLHPQSLPRDISSAGFIKCRDHRVKGRELFYSIEQLGKGAESYPDKMTTWKTENLLS
jgi:hypothetical protein